jgi:hypothetical protein
MEEESARQRKQKSRWARDTKREARITRAKAQPVEAKEPDEKKVQVVPLGFMLSEGSGRVAYWHDSTSSSESSESDGMPPLRDHRK